MANFTKYSQLANQLIKTRSSNVRHLAAAAQSLRNPQIEYTKVFFLKIYNYSLIFKNTYVFLSFLLTMNLLMQNLVKHLKLLIQLTEK